MVNYETPKQCLNFKWTVLIFILVWLYVTFELNFFQRILHLTRSRLAFLPYMLTVILNVIQ